jgi:hemoglobin
MKSRASARERLNRGAVRYGSSMPADDQETLYDRVGGLPFFTELVDRFYDGILEDEYLGPLYPADDLDGASERLALFLAQYWGGPPLYMEQRGHPRLRMRHAEFKITKRVRDAWITRMLAAVDEMQMEPEDRGELIAYLDMAARQLRNR